MVTEYAEGELFQVLEDDGSLPEQQVCLVLMDKKLSFFFIFYACKGRCVTMNDKYYIEKSATRNYASKTFFSTVEVLFKATLGIFKPKTKLTVVFT